MGTFIRLGRKARIIVSAIKADRIRNMIMRQSRFRRGALFLLATNDTSSRSTASTHHFLLKRRA